MLVLLAGGIPKFDVYPSPHEDDAEYLRGVGESWWPQDTAMPNALHEFWNKFEPKA